MDRVKGKVAIVTGGANGIGEATAKLLAKEGAGVGIVDVDDKNGARVIEEITSEGGDAVYRHADITIEEEVAHAFAGFYEKYGKLHILVNNAGIAGSRVPAHKATVKDFDRIIDLCILYLRERSKY